VSLARQEPNTVSLTTYLLLAISSLPTFKEDVGEFFLPKKRAQAEIIAQAIAEVSETTRGWPGSKRELASLLLTVAWHETRLSLRIHDGLCKPYECDRGRARGLWQLHAHASLPKERWLAVAGLDLESTRNGAAEAAKALVRSRRLCLRGTNADWVAPTLSAYAGLGCGGSLPDAAERVRTFRRLVAIQPKRGSA
jgi:hypothetical protein